MKWLLEIDDTTHDILNSDKLQFLIESPEAQSATSVVLEKVRLKKASLFERFLYKMLGLKLDENLPLGSMQVSLSSTKAQVIFIRNDDDNGMIGIAPIGQPKSMELLEFSTTTGEKFYEPISNCIPRELAIQALQQFYATGKRPQNLKWVKVGS